MTTPMSLSNHYKKLGPEERFRLILAASARGDDAERERVRQSSRPLSLVMPDHAPYSHAFSDVSLSVYLDLLEEAARYDELWLRVDAEDDRIVATGTEPTDDQLRVVERFQDLALATGYVLRAKHASWVMFCDALTLPHAVLWAECPGHDRVARAVGQAERMAFTQEGFVRWLNSVKPDEVPEVTHPTITPENVCAEIEATFQSRVRWWRGR